MLPAGSFTCSSITGTCSGNPLFVTLQRELNRVRPIYGLPADVGVDGKIGTKTLAKLIKTAQAIDRRLGQVRDSALDDYTYPDIALNVTPKMLAFEADAVVAALRRNGYSTGHVPPEVAAQSVIDPYVNNVASGLPVPPNFKSVLPSIGPLVVNVGPTANTTSPAPIVPVPLTSKIPTGVKIAGGIVLGLGAVVGVAAAIAKARNG
jgi:hypothetical protein